MATEWARTEARRLTGKDPDRYLSSAHVAEALDAAKTAGRTEANTREVERRREAEAHSARRKAALANMIRRFEACARFAGNDDATIADATAKARLALEEPESPPVDRCEEQVHRAVAAEKEAAWLRRLIQWCRPRLRREQHDDALDRYLAAGPTDAPDDPPIAASVERQGGSPHG